MTAATLVGLMSIPALAVLYGGLVQKKWAMNTVLMVFVTFCLTLIVWVLWAYKMGFGTPLISTFVGDPRTILGASGVTLEYPPIRHANNLEAVLTYEGTEEIHLLAIGQALTGISAYR